MTCQYGPGHDEEIDEYGIRCRRCGCIIWDMSPDDYDICRNCWERQKKKKSQ